MRERILFPVGETEVAEAALDEVLAVAREHGSTVHVLYVADASDDMLHTYSEPIEESHDEVLADIEERARELVREVTDVADERGVETVVAIGTHGTPHEAILDYAAEHDVDLIVMGTHGRTGFDRLANGSVTEDVLRRAPVPVLTVRAPEA